MSQDFQFFDPGLLVDGELSLELLARNPADPMKMWVPSYDFDLHVNGSPEQVGRINFRAVNTPPLEIYGGHFAYCVLPAFRGHHYAERGVRLLFPLARQHGFRTVWITCNPENYPSRRTCERLGAELVEIVPLPPDNDMYLEGERFKCRYRIAIGYAENNGDEIRFHTPP